ncbi:MAG TPA: GNAT family N-acetyltransferase [Planococcus sp. (in: firmicutes)]|nr:GNAT family N-acetyltransferase [Planococcus sp. (in: firmicutes)]
MEPIIRKLSPEDFPAFDAMESGVEDDYVKRIFKDIASTERHQLYGLFVEGQLVSLCGLSVFAGSYAMIGRIRSDIRFRGQAFATRLTAYVIEEAQKRPNIRWIGANTQEANLPARRVLEKLGLQPYKPMIGAIGQDVSLMEKGAGVWSEMHSLVRKKIWIEQLYIKTGALFPYECYYLFPSTEGLFSDDKLAEWSFFENRTGDRVLILQHDFKAHYHLHVIYPWDDLMEQAGLWETISAEYRKLASQYGEETDIWMELTKEQAASLPEGHRFDFPSAWVLYGLENSPV